MLAGVAATPLGQRREVLNEEDRQRSRRAQARRLPAQLVAIGRAPAAVDRIADVDAAPAHRGHVCREIVALQRDVAKAGAAREKVQQRGTRETLLAFAHREQLEIVVLEERDRVLGAAVRVHAAGAHAEADARVGVDRLRQIRHADHDVVDARQHDDDSFRSPAAVSHSASRAARNARSRALSTSSSAARYCTAASARRPSRRRKSARAAGNR